MEASSTDSLSKSYLWRSWKRNKPKNIKFHVKQPQVLIFPLWEWEKRFNEQKPFLLLIRVISKPHISVSGPAKTLMVFRNMLWFVVVGAFHGIWIQAWFQQRTSLRGVSSGVTESLKDLASNFAVTKKGSSLIQPGKSQWRLQLRRCSSDFSKLTRCVQLLAVLPMFQDETLTGAFWLSPVSYSGSELLGDCSCPVPWSPCQSPLGVTFRLNRLDWLGMDKLDGDLKLLFPTTNPINSLSFLVIMDWIFIN